MEEKNLETLRSRIDELDAAILDAITERLEICKQVARLKKCGGIPMMNEGRVALVRERARQKARENGLEPGFFDRLFEGIIHEACRLEDEIIGTSAGGPR